MQRSQCVWTLSNTSCYSEQKWKGLSVYKFYCLICLCPFLCWGSERASEEESLFLNRIADFWEEGEYQIAKNQIQEFLNLYPNSSFSDSLCSAIGDLLVREKNYPPALDYYAKITDPEIGERIFPHRMQCLYAMQWYAILADECEAYLQSSSENHQITYYLAIALYHQCLNAANDPEILIPLAKRAEPYFETLSQSSLKPDLAAAFAHLLCILKEFPKAAAIYLDLADGENGDEMLFQAACIQAEYDKELALQTFGKIAKSQQEAAYNCLVLSFDLKKYEAILEGKEPFLQTLPQARLGDAHLFFGRSFFALEKYQEACLEFESYIDTGAGKSVALRSILISYIDAAVHAEDLNSLSKAIDKMESLYPLDEDLFKGKFSKALLLAKQNKLLEAKQDLETLLSHGQNPDVLLKLIHVNEQMGEWVSCRNSAVLYLSLFETQASIARKYLVSASSEIAKNSLEGKQQLINDLQNVLEKEKNPLWQFLLAKTFFSIQAYKEALPLLLEPVDADTSLLLALCYRDGFQDLQNFTLFGEKALALKNGSIDEGSLHAALYNAYLERQLLDPAEDHLFAAFQAGSPVNAKNLLWLANRYIHKNKVEEAVALIESFQEEAATLLENLKEEPSHEALLLLGEIYAGSGRKEKAKEIFDAIACEKSNLKTRWGASASLQSARLQAEKWKTQAPAIDDLSFQQVLAQLKDLVLQKNISHEPIYLEASLDYIELQSKAAEGQGKKLFLLQKMKQDFENTDDLLSKDYHAARGEQNFIYQSYMQFLEAEILSMQSEKELQAKAKDLLLKIVEEKAHPALVARANQCLNR